MKTLFVLDLDGTVCEASRRFKEAGPEPTRDNKEVYDAWVTRVQSETSLLQDTPVPGMLALAWALTNEPDSMLVYLTSREARWRDVTYEWLEQNQFPSETLFMRPNGDYSEGADFKEREILWLQAEYNPTEIVVIDDDERGTIETKCHNNGWTFLKACSGGNKSK